MRFFFEPEREASKIRRAKPASSSHFLNLPGSSQDLQNHAGNQAIQSLFRSGAVQASLAVGHLDDPDEREADEIANRIAGASADGAKSKSANGQESSLQRQAFQGNASSNIPGIVEQLVQSTGHPLDPATRSFFESRFDRELGHIRIHTDQQAADSTRSIHALAYTIGNHISFAHGRYSPHTNEGNRLLAHELVHTVQQSKRGSSIVQRSPDLGGLTVSVAHKGTNIPFSGVNVHIDQKLVSSAKSIDLVTDSSGNTPSIQLEEGSYTITISYKCCSQTQDVRISGNVDQVTFFELGRCECGIASSDPLDQGSAGPVASADSNSPAPNDQANA